MPKITLNDQKVATSLKLLKMFSEGKLTQSELILSLDMVLKFSL